jgi:hypothetical protein
MAAHTTCATPDGRARRRSCHATHLALLAPFPACFAARRAPLVSRFFVSPCTGGASEAHGLVQEVRSLLDADSLARPLCERLEVLEEALSRRRATLDRAASLADSTPRSVLTAVREGGRALAAAPGGTRDAGGAGAADGDESRFLSLGDDALAAACNTERFLSIHRALSTLDVNSAASRLDCIGRCCQPDCLIMIRQLLSADRLLARRHPALELVYMLNVHLPEYLEYVTTVDTATGAIKPRLRSYALSKPLPDGTREEGPFVKALRRCDLAGADFGAEVLALQGLKENHAPRPIKRIDYVCLLELLEEIGAYGQRVLVGLGAPTTVTAGFTFEAWYLHVRDHVKLAREIVSLEEQVNFLLHAHQQLQEGLRIMGATLRTLLGVGRPHAHSLGALLPADAKPVTELARKAKSLDAMQEIAHDYPLFGRVAGPSSLSHHLPLLSEYSDGMKYVAKGPPGKGKGGVKGGGKEQPVLGKRGASTVTQGTGKGAAPGSLEYLFAYLSASQLLMKGAVWDLTKLAKACGTTVAAKDWPFIISRMMPHNKPGLCAKFGTPGAHCDDTSAAHVCATFDYDVMIETCARYATATEKVLLAKQATDAGADGKGKGGGRGKGAGKGAGGRGGGRRGGRGGAHAHDSSEAGGGQPS